MSNAQIAESDLIETVGTFLSYVGGRPEGYAAQLERNKVATRIIAAVRDATPAIKVLALREAATDAMGQCFCCPATDDWSPVSYWLRARAEEIEAGL